jgi:OOP family OmpA-OmpF porin
MIRLPAILVATFVFVNVMAQNLVPNPSFEEVTVCPQSFYLRSADFAIPGWTSPTLGTPDLFHACSRDEAGVPFNWAGESNAHSGKGYSGIYVWDSELSANYREYLQGELAEPLKEGQKYLVEFYYKSAPNSVYIINRMGLSFSETPIKLQHNYLIGQTPTLSISKDEIKVGPTTGEWELASMIYQAKGGERYVIIGNFFSNEETKNKRLPWRFGKNKMLDFKSYYYIDDVSVKSLDSLKKDLVPVTEKFINDSFELNKVYSLENITFEFDSHLLLRQSFVELDKIVEHLTLHKEIQVRISGHTDFVGTDDYNLTLSRNRARSVADYFISKGIASQRIITYGFGKSYPVKVEKTEEDRKANRRVEIKFVTE